MVHWLNKPCAWFALIYGALDVLYIKSYAFKLCIVELLDSITTLDNPFQ